ncbi:unnamed protein product [Ilex paraguariensis]|uniref:Uncharacterized protein n=1 Tax=Ilex paraguariensis TaxID=185542 RepID=A0ABC8R6V2_9AQUA
MEKGEMRKRGKDQKVDAGELVSNSVGVRHLVGAKSSETGAKGVGDNVQGPMGSEASEASKGTIGSVVANAWADKAGAKNAGVIGRAKKASIMVTKGRHLEGASFRAGTGAWAQVVQVRVELGARCNKGVDDSGSQTMKGDDNRTNSPPPTQVSQ